MAQRYTYLLIVAFVLITGFTYFFSLAGVDEIIHPVRVDSLYVKAEEQDMLNQQFGPVDLVPHFYYSPSDFNMCYHNFEVKTIDSLSLKGWFIPTFDGNNNTTIVILHDLHESRITSLETAKQFYDRGYSICLVDMRGHGASEGKVFSFGYMEKYDVKSVLDTIESQFNVKNIAILGLGTGAGVAIQAANLDIRIKVLVTQSPFNNLVNFVQVYSKEKWPVVNSLIFPRIKKHLEDELQFNLSDINVGEIAKKITIPTLFIAGASDKNVPLQHSWRVFKSCISLKKEFWLVQKANHYNIEELAGADYYNRVSVFLVRNMPKKIKKTRFKKFV